MASYAIVLGVALASRLALLFAPFSYVSDGQRAMWSWPLCGVFVVGFAAAVALARKAELPTPADALATTKAALAAPAAVGATVALLTIWSDAVAPVAVDRGVASVHVPGWAALPFYAYGAILLTTLFHFLPMAFLACLARGRDRNTRLLLVAVGVAVVGLSEDLGYFARTGLLPDLETARHVLSVAANSLEALFIYRLGLLAGLVQRSTTYLLWHLLWPALGQV